ncbi:hypothetical protein HYR99_35300 [Candidatus Poribacteria bacterium]|nr:hypothetical protein [Candidatus Poribacteria bacterium]
MDNDPILEKVWNLFKDLSTNLRLEALAKRISRIVGWVTFPLVGLDYLLMRNKQAQFWHRRCILLDKSQVS